MAGPRAARGYFDVGPYEPGVLGGEMAPFEEGAPAPRGMAGPGPMSEDFCRAGPMASWPVHTPRPGLCVMVGVWYFMLRPRFGG